MRLDLRRRKLFQRLKKEEELITGSDLPVAGGNIAKYDNFSQRVKVSGDAVGGPNGASGNLVKDSIL